ncbi:MAG TPA: AbrB/MazE/SpoVT family DNA-binding domain-containing protein [Noviherbaspirillum sp.]|nr:AbrB/MazE/SpoVT family DNA-binding domain-containing protein [Noviherbaspirillum sp.]
MMPTYSERQDLAKQFAADVARMQRCLEAAGKQVDVDDIVYAWADYSDAVCAGWLMLPEDDDALRAVLLKHLPPAGRRWSITIVDAGDRSGDGMLLLPKELLAQMDWKPGDRLAVTLEEPGVLTVQRAASAA